MRANVKAQRLPAGIKVGTTSNVVAPLELKKPDAPLAKKKADAYGSTPALLKSASPATVEASLPAATRSGLEAIYAAIPAESWQRVVQLGAPVESAKPYLNVGATVVVLDASKEQLTQAKQKNLRFHHLAQGTLASELPKAGIRDGNADLIIAAGKLDAPLDVALPKIFAALDSGGRFAWTYEGDRAAVEAALVKAGFSLEQHAAVNGSIGYGDAQQVLIAKKPGEPVVLPKALERMDRTSCVDRKAVLEAHGASLVQGPLALKVVAGDDSQLRSQMKTMLDAVFGNLKVDPANVPLPTVVAREGTLGKPGCDGLVLLAHPDDESGFSGGTLRAAADQGLSIKIASVTGGEGGRSSSGVSGAELAASRGKELQHVSDLLGAKGIELMGFSDFGKYSDDQRSVPTTRSDSLEKWGVMPLLEKMVRSIRENRPKTLLTFDTKHDPDYALHGHHLATGLAANLAFHLAGMPDAFPDQLKAGLKPWTPLRQQVVSSNEREGERFTKLNIDTQRKREVLEAHGSQTYSLEEMFEAIDERKPYAQLETWHLTQARDGGNLTDDPLQRLFG